MEEIGEKRLRGIIPPMVTPLVDHTTLDIEGLERLVEYLLAGGVHGLFLLGTTGEGPSLDYGLRRDLIRHTIEFVAARVQTVVCVSETSLNTAVKLAKYAADVGADAVVASAPYYYSLSQQELRDYIQKLAQAISLPLYLYNIPQMTRTVFSVDTVRQLLDLENVVGIKDSSGDLEYLRQLHQVVSRRDDFVLLTGVEESLVESMHLGAHGGVCGGANVFPQLHVNLYDACMRSDAEKMALLSDIVRRVSDSLYHIQDRDSRFVNALKGSLAQYGVCSEVVAPPMEKFNSQEQLALRQRLRELLSLDCPAINSVLKKAYNRLTVHDGTFRVTSSPRLDTKPAVGKTTTPPSNAL